jgi:TPR repeat protein
MFLRKCEKCGGELRGHAAARLGCSAGTSPAIILGVLAVCLLVGFLFVVSTAKQKTPPAPPEVAEIVNLEEIKAKAEGGEAEAQRKLGDIYAKGRSVKLDYKEAAKWYRQAADQGHPAAQTALGELYEAGQGVQRDETEAAKCYRQAAEQGYSPAQYSLAVLYVMGKGLPQDNAEALKWYRQAAEQGDALAQFNLGMRFYEGKAVAPDPVEAYKWLSLAAAQRMPDAAKALDDVKRGMTREQKAEGKRRVEAFAPKRPAPQSPTKG